MYVYICICAWGCEWEYSCIHLFLYNKPDIGRFAGAEWKEMNTEAQLGTYLTRVNPICVGLT